MDGGAPSKLQDGVQAAEKLVPLANSYPMAFAMLAVIVFAGACVWIFYRRDKARSAELNAMVEVNKDQAEDLSAIAALLAVLPTILSYLQTIAQVLKINDGELQKAIEVARKAADGLASRKKERDERRKRTTGSNVARPELGDVDSGQKPAAGAGGGKDKP